MVGALDGRVVLVTGAGRGIGREIALASAREGAAVLINDLGTEADGSGHDRSLSESVVQEILAMGGRAVGNVDDVSTMDGAESMVQQALETFGQLDVVVNNAGILRDHMVFNMTEAEWDDVVRVHLKGTFATIRAAAPVFRTQKSGRFVNFTSTSGLIGNFGQANYAAAKLGIVGLTRITALEMAKYGVTANAVAPFAWTRLLGTIPDDPRQQTRLEKLKKMTPDKVAPLVVFLASAAAQEISGQVFAVRGDELILFSLPRPVRTLHHQGGWSVNTLAEVLPDAWRRSFTPLETTSHVFPYDPLV